MTGAGQIQVAAEGKHRAGRKRESSRMCGRHRWPRRVALKVLRTPATVMARPFRLFEREIRVQAQLRHPSIARILDSGYTTEGQAYYAIDIRTDVYSLGVILYELLTGHHPYCVIGHVIDVLRKLAARHRYASTVVIRRMRCAPRRPRRVS